MMIKKLKTSNIITFIEAPDLKKYYFLDFFFINQPNELIFMQNHKLSCLCLNTKKEASSLILSLLGTRAQIKNI